MVEIKAILFDLDNTLIDFMAMKQKSCQAAMTAMIKAGLKINKKKGIKLLFQLYEKYGIEYQLIFEKFLQKVLGKVDYKILTHGIYAYRLEEENTIQPYPGTISTLKALKKKGLKLAIISDAPRIKAWNRLVIIKIDNFFDLILTAGDVRKQKTSITPFHVALKRLKIKPEESIMIGDRVSRDIKNAKKLGIKTCYARYGAMKKVKSGADFEINNIRELLKIID